MNLRHTSKEHPPISIHFQDEEIKVLFHKYLQKFPQAIQHLIQDMKAGKLLEKIIRLGEPDGILRFFVKDNQICIEHRLDVPKGTTTAPYTSLPPKESRKTPHSSRQTAAPFGDEVLHHIESSLEEDY